MLSKETFMKEMRAIKEFSDYLDKIEDECQFLFNGDHPAYEFLSQTLEMLEEACNLPAKNGLIDYFVTELNWGMDYYDGCVTDADGNNISLNCLDELWDEIQVEAAIS